MTADLIIAAVGFLVGVLTGVLVTTRANQNAQRRAYIEGRDNAIDNAAMKAYDMGHPEVREAINSLVERSA